MRRRVVVERERAATRVIQKRRGEGRGVRRQGRRRSRRMKD